MKIPEPEYRRMPKFKIEKPFASLSYYVYISKRIFGIHYRWKRIRHAYGTFEQAKEFINDLKRDYIAFRSKTWYL